MSVLEVSGVSIRYMTGDFKDIGLKEYIMRRLKGNYHINEFWADRDISFALEKGDMLGIIGSNGAGKSTLLKVISGIMEPTEGWVRREGNVAALLELASGFDGELTVRENTYLRGAMLGYTRKFMDETYDKIIIFAELADFRDRPFKQLSSGMKSRLAFSIASLVQPDILILDDSASALDLATDARLRQAIGALEHKPTVFIVSQRTASLRHADKIVVLDDGQAVGVGTHEELLETCPVYREIYDSQFQKGEEGAGK